MGRSIGRVVRRLGCQPRGAMPICGIISTSQTAARRSPRFPRSWETERRRHHASGFLGAARTSAAPSQEQSVLQQGICFWHSSSSPRFSDFGGKGVAVCSRWIVHPISQSVFDCFAVRTRWSPCEGQFAGTVSSRRLAESPPATSATISATNNAIHPQCCRG